MNISGLDGSIFDAVDVRSLSLMGRRYMFPVIKFVTTTVGKVASKEWLRLCGFNPNIISVVAYVGINALPRVFINVSLADTRESILKNDISAHPAETSSRAWAAKLLSITQASVPRWTYAVTLPTIVSRMDAATAQSHIVKKKQVTRGMSLSHSSVSQE